MQGHAHARLLGRGDRRCQEALHALPHPGLVHGGLVRLGAVLVEGGVVEGAVSRAAAAGVRGGAEVAHGFEVPAHAGDAGAAHALQHPAPVADLLVHVLTGEGDLLPGGHEDVVQLQAVGLDLLPRLGQRVGAVLAGPDVLRQRGVGRSGAGPAAGGGCSSAQVQVDGVHADGAEEPQVSVVELVDGDLVLDVHQATGRLRWFCPP